MDKKRLEGLIAAPFTPMDGKGKINVGIIKQYAHHLIESGVNGAFICGTTGEGVSMTLDERKLIAEEWIANSSEKLKIVVHVGSVCQAECMELARHAEASGAFAVASIAPFFFVPSTPDDLISFIKPVAESAPGIPFYYYHMPSITGINISVSDFIKKAGELIPNFSGVKYTHSDFMDMQECIRASNNKYEIFNGLDEYLLCGLSLGVKSAVGSTYNFMASIYLSLWNAFDHSDMEKARELQQFSVKIIRILNKYGGAVRAGKAIMSLIGIDCGQCRPPIKYMDDNEKTNLKKDLADAGFFDN